MRTLLRLLALLLLVGGAWLHAQSAGGHALKLAIDGPIGPATADYLHRAFVQAQEEGAELIILRMDTPGGLDTSMRTIIQEILASPIPVVSHVAPSGARAASAGTYILYASHIAAMAPATNLGAATPVAIGPSFPTGEGEADKPQPADAKERKLVNDAVAYIQGLAKLRGRNAEWAERAVREGVSLDAQAALEKDVVDVIAEDTDDLLAALDGMTVQLAARDRTLHTDGMRVEEHHPDWRSELLALITNPNIAYILMLVGVYGLIFEFSNPGAILPGVAGAICLLLALYAFQVLPVNYAGLGLMLLGLALMVGEAFAPSFGALGIGGLIAFVIGSVILMDTEAPGFGISFGLIAAVGLFSLLLLVFVVGMVLKSRDRPVVSGMEELTGAVAVAQEDFAEQGLVRLHGELWRARSEVPVHKGERLVVTAADGLTLRVRKGD